MNAYFPTRSIYDENRKGFGLAMLSHYDDDLGESVFVYRCPPNEGFYEKMDNPKCFVTEDEEGNYREIHYLLESELRRNDEEITRKAKEINSCIS
jgi:hypothetical protein